MRRYYLLFCFLCLTLSTTSVRTEDELAIARAQLDRAIFLIDKISSNVERVTDGARLHLIKRNILAVKGSLQTNGLAHAATMRSYQQLIVTFRYSSAFLRHLETDYNSLAVKELFDINQLIVRARGFDDQPYTQITLNVFTEMHQLLLQLKGLATLPERLKPKLDALTPKLGNLIAIARQGDRPRTFAAAVPMYAEIAALYPDFGSIQHSNPAFDIILDIQGLNEFYAEYAQIENK